MTVLGRGLIFQPVLLACRYNNDEIHNNTIEKKSTLLIHIKVYTHKKVESTSKGNWHGIRIEQAKRNKMTLSKQANNPKIV